MAGSTADKTPPIPRDGRTERADRTRRAIAGAMLSLLEEGDLQPTAPRVAERAGVALRTVFHHFDDMESLLDAVSQRQVERWMSDINAVPREGPVAERVERLAAERARIHEGITPVRRAALLMEPFSPGIAQRLAWIRLRGRRELERVFAAELARLAAGERRDLLEALTAAASWSTWESLRAHQQLTVPQARRTMARLLRALLKEDA